METRPAMFSDGKVLRARQEALQNRTATPAPPLSPPLATPPRSASPTRIEISTRRAATWDPSIQEVERGMAPTQPDPGAWRTTSADTTLPLSPLVPEFLRGSSFEAPVPDSLLGEPDFDATPASDETAYPATTLEFRSEAFSAFAAARLRRDGRPDVDLPLDMPTAPAPLTPQVTQAPPPLPASAPVAPSASHDEEPASPADAVVPIPVSEPALAAPEPEQPAFDDLEKTLDLSAGRVSAPAPVPSVPDEAVVTPLSASNTVADTVTDAAPLPEFVRRADNQARWHRPTVRAALCAVAMLLTGLLVWQTSRHWHDLIAVRWPVTRPLLARACQQWQCQLQAPQRLDALVVDSTTLSRPASADGYVLGVTLHNRAGHAIAAPHIELSLTDMAGTVVLRRVLTPAEFRQASTLAAQSDASWSLEFSSTNQRIAGYTLAAFYP
jgi:Protein of unknown function (DUF3426)